MLNGITGASDFRVVPSKIGLCGTSGAGKTTVAIYLRQKYNFTICNTGARCRRLALELFGTDSKAALQRVSDAIHGMEPGIWLRRALADVPESAPRLVIDSLRYPEDFQYAREAGLSVWRVEASLEIRRRRLAERRQEYHPVTDASHSTETAFLSIPEAILVRNDYDSVSSLFAFVDQLLV